MYTLDAIAGSGQAILVRSVDIDVVILFGKQIVRIMKLIRPKKNSGCDITNQRTSR